MDLVASALIADFGLIDDFSWTRWFMLMAVPFYLILIIGGAAVYLLYRSGFTFPDSVGAVELKAGPIQSKEIRADHSLGCQKIGQLAKPDVVIVLPTIDQCGEQPSSGQREGNTWKDSRAWFFGHGEQVLRKVRFRDGGYFR